MPESATKLRELARSSTATVVRLGAAATLLFTALVQLLFPPEGEADVGRAGALLCCVAAMGCLLPPSGAALRGSHPRAGWVPAAAVGGCLVAVSCLQVVSGLAGPWPAQYLVSWLLIVVMGSTQGPRAAAAAVLVSLGLLLWEGVAAGPDDVLDATPFVVITRALQVVVLGLGAVAVLRLLDRATSAADAEAEALDEEQARAEALRHAARATDELRRTLHDTVVNTLEAISAHGDLLGRDAIERRCRADIGVVDEWLQRTPGTGPAEDLRAALGLEAERASERGLHVVVSGSSPPRAVDLPGPVAMAIVRAVREALSNVAKHAGTDLAEMVIETDRPGVRVVVRDKGRGFAPGTPGVGLSESVLGRLQDVGGTATIDSEPGRGTAIAVEWSPTRRVEPEPAAEWSTRLAWLVALVGASVGLITGVGLLVGWQSLERPLVALAAALLPLLWLAWLLLVVARGHRVDAWDAAATLVVVAASALLGPHADPYCAGSFGELASFEVRIALLSALVLWRPRLRTLVISVVAVLVIGGVQGMHWRGTWSDCGAVSWVSSLLGALAIAAAWWVGRATDRQHRVAQQNRRRVVEARAAGESIRLIAAEAAAWTDQALAASRAVLRDVLAALPSREADPSLVWEGVRLRCSLQAESLRALIGLGTGVAPLTRMLRSWVVGLNPAEARVIVRGRLRDLDPPEPAIAALSGVLRSTVPSATYVLLGWRDGSEAGLVLTGPAGAFPSAPTLVEAEEDPGWSTVLDHDGSTESVTCTWIVGAGDRA